MTYDDVMSLTSLAGCPAVREEQQSAANTIKVLMVSSETQDCQTGLRPSHSRHQYVTDQTDLVLITGKFQIRWCKVGKGHTDGHHVSQHAFPQYY